MAPTTYTAFEDFWPSLETRPTGGKGFETADLRDLKVPHLSFSKLLLFILIYIVLKVYSKPFSNHTILYSFYQMMSDEGACLSDNHCTTIVKSKKTEMVYN